MASSVEKLREHPHVADLLCGLDIGELRRRVAHRWKLCEFKQIMD
jgi:hypothetical protein